MKNEDSLTIIQSLFAKATKMKISTEKERRVIEGIFSKLEKC